MGPSPGPGARGRLVVAAGAALLLAVLALVYAGTRPAAPTARPVVPAQATATETDEPTEVPPTPIPVTETVPPPDRCVRGLPAPRFQWTLYVTAWSTTEGLGMWVPRGTNAGPFLKAYVMAKYGHDWYGATLLPDGRMVPDRYPAWPRPDLIQSAANGVQTTRAGNPTCGRGPQKSVPPCFVEVVYPLVFLDRLAEDGPYLTRTYFWAPASQLVKEGDRSSQIMGAPFSETSCDTRKFWPRLRTTGPVYGVFNGCGSDSKRIDTCYALGFGEFAGGEGP